MSFELDGSPVPEVNVTQAQVTVDLLPIHSGKVQLSIGECFFQVCGEANTNTLVCCHGIGSGSYVFHYLMRALAASGYRVISFSMYGRIGSSYLDIPHTADLFANQLYELLRSPAVYRLGLAEGREPHSDLSAEPSVSILGHSMGGALAIYYTWKFPRDVRDVVLIGSAGLPWSLPFGAFILNVPILADYVHYYYVNKVSKSIEHDFFCPDNCQEVIDFLISQKRTRDEWKATRSFVNSFAHFPLQDLEKHCHEIAKLYRDKRFLVLFGEHDDVVPVGKCYPHFRRIFESHPQAHFGLIERTRHTPFLERRDAVHGVVRDFLDGKLSGKDITI